MSTNANINVKIGDKYHSIYLHWDGYPDHALKTLRDCYPNQVNAEALVSLGDLSVLAERVHPLDPDHSMENPEDGVCQYYGRDRGETGVEVSISDKPSTDQEYNYLFEDGKWKMWEDS